MIIKTFLSRMKLFKLSQIFRGHENNETYHLDDNQFPPLSNITGFCCTAFRPCSSTKLLLFLDIPGSDSGMSSSDFLLRESNIFEEAQTHFLLVKQ